MVRRINRLTGIGVALLIPAVFGSGLIVNAFQVDSEVLIAREDKEFGLEDIDRLIEEVSNEEEAGNYKKALDLLVIGWMVYQEQYLY